MTLHELTEDDVRDFAGATIFGRGDGYYRSGMIYEFDYDYATDGILAEVSGNYGSYEVEIRSDIPGINADCTCPYDGYPCKHIVAVLLMFIHESETHIERAEERQAESDALIERIENLSKAELVELLISGLEKYPDFQRDVALQLAPDDRATVSELLKEVNKAFPSIHSGGYSMPGIAKRLREILRSVDDAPVAARLKVYWAVADRTLKELNEYGVNDQSLEGIAIDAMERVVGSARQVPNEKPAVIASLMDYYTWGNCGITYSIYQAVNSLCFEESDYRIVIQKLEAHQPRSGFGLYHQDLLPSLYEEIGDTDSQLRVLESALEYGLDYWRLAEHWLERGDREKAMDLVTEGLEKGTGRKTELYAYFQEVMVDDPESLFSLLETKVKNNDLDNQYELASDSTYLLLLEHYQSANDYEGQAKLLELRYANEPMSLNLYKDAEKTLNLEDWKKFGTKIIQHLRKSIKQKESAQPLWGQHRTSAEERTLAQIYDDKGDLKRLLEIAQTDLVLLVKYESKLLPEHPEIYLEQYASEIDRLIGARGRENYREAAKYAKTVKSIYHKHFEMPEEWAIYIGELRETHKRLRAMKEEFAGL